MWPEFLALKDLVSMDCFFQAELSPLQLWNVPPTTIWPTHPTTFYLAGESKSRSEIKTQIYSGRTASTQNLGLWSKTSCLSGLATINWIVFQSGSFLYGSTPFTQVACNFSLEGCQFWPGGGTPSLVHLLFSKHAGFGTFFIPPPSLHALWR